MSFTRCLRTTINIVLEFVDGLYIFACGSALFLIAFLISINLTTIDILFCLCTAFPSTLISIANDKWPLSIFFSLLHSIYHFHHAYAIFKPIYLFPLAVSLSSAVVLCVNFTSFTLSYIYFVSILTWTSLSLSLCVVWEIMLMRNAM